MTYYFAAFCPVPEGGYAISFPDFPEVASEGKDLAEAMDMAADALKISLEEYVRTGRPIPDPSPIEKAKAVTEAENAELGFIPAGSVLYPLIASPAVDRTPVKVTISLPKNVLESLDQKARLAGLTRSGYIASMAG